MALVKEDGSGVANADTWAAISDADAYATRMNYIAWVDGEQEQKEAALRRGVFYLDAVYGSRYAGVKANPFAEQSLSWPRSYVVDDDGYPVDDDAIPVNLIYAQIESAFIEFGTPGKLMPGGGASSSSSSGARLQKAVTVGPIHVEYEDSGKSTVGGGTGTEGIYTTYATVDGLMQPLLDDQKAGGYAYLRRA